MNTILLKRASVLLGITAVTVVATGLTAQAQTTNLNAADIKPKQTLDTKALTSASALRGEPSATKVAQVDTTTPDTYESVPPATTPETSPGVTEPAPGAIEPGRATRSGSSYIGAAGNIGLTGGETALGIGNFTVISKIGLTEAVLSASRGGNWG